MNEFKIKNGLVLGNPSNSQPVLGITDSSDFGNLPYEDTSALATVNAIKNYISTHQGSGSVNYGDVSQIPFMNSSSDGFSYSSSLDFDGSILSIGNKLDLFSDSTSFNINYGDTSIFYYDGINSKSVITAPNTFTTATFENDLIQLWTAPADNVDNLSFLRLSNDQFYMRAKKDASLDTYFQGSPTGFNLWTFNLNTGYNIANHFELNHYDGILLKTSKSTKTYSITMDPSDGDSIVIEDTDSVGARYKDLGYSSTDDRWLTHKKYVDDKFNGSDPSGNYLLLTGGTIDGSLVINHGLTVSGDVIIDGSLYIRDVETIDVSSAFINLNTGETGSPPATMQSGIIVNRGTSDPYVFLYDESNETFRVGTAPLQTGPSFDDASTQSVATREDDPTDTGIAFWNNTLSRFDTSSGMTRDSNGRLTITGESTGIGVDIQSKQGYGSLVSGNVYNGSGRAWLFGRNGTTSNDVTLSAYLGKVTLDTYPGEAYIKKIGTQTYNKIWHEGNVGIGSGLDADTLDTVHAAQFLRSDEDDSTSGKLTVNNQLVVNRSAGGDLLSLRYPAGKTGYIRGVKDGVDNWYFGNPSATSDDLYLSNYQNADLIVRTNNVNRLTIKGDGKVGIGTSTPTEQLDVNGNIQTSGKVKINSANGLVIDDGTTDGLFTIATNTGGHGIIKTDSDKELRFYTNNTQKAVLSKDGTFGLNIASPASAYKLDVNGAILCRNTGTNAVYSYGGYSVGQGYGRGIKFWNSDSYKIYMSPDSDATWGGNLVNDTDYHMYFVMNGGTNRGFVWKNNHGVIGQLSSDGNLWTKKSIGTSVNGSASDPTITWLSDTNTGFFHTGTSGRISLSTDGVENFRWDASTFHAKGDIVAFSSTLSDIRLKKDVNYIIPSKALNKVLKLNPIEYKFIDRDDVHIGFVAQEVEHIIPEVVVEHEIIGQKGKYKTIRYQEIIPYNTAAIRELNDKIKSQEKTIKSQEKRISDLEKDLKKIFLKLGIYK